MADAPRSIAKGSRLYWCTRHDDDGLHHIDVVTVVDIKQTYTAKGKRRKPVYLLHAENFCRGKYAQNGVQDYETSDIEWYSPNAVEAVMCEFRNLFNANGRMDSPEERLLAAVFGEKPDIRFAASEIPSVIADLKNFHRLFGEAFKLDEETVKNM